MPHLLLACGVGILFFALIQLLAGSNQPLRNMIVFNCFAISYVSFYLWAAATGLLVKLPALANSDIALRYPTVMSFYLAALTILHEGRRPVRSYAVYYIAPALLAACSGLYSVLISPMFLRMHGALPGHYSNPLFMTLTTGWRPLIHVRVHPQPSGRPPPLPRSQSPGQSRLSPSGGYPFCLPGFGDIPGRKQRAQE